MQNNRIALFSRWIMIFLYAGCFFFIDNARAADTYDNRTGDLTLPMVRVGNTLFLNFVIHLDTIGPVTLGPGAASGSYDTYDPATGILTIPTVLIGGVPVNNVSAPITFTVILPGTVSQLVNTNPTLILVNPMPSVVVGQQYSQSLVAAIAPQSQYTYMVDTLANGALPTGMTIDMNGNLNGKPFATGAADVNGNQIPNVYTFGVCATDTLTRQTTRPCPQTSIEVFPLPSVVGVWVYSDPVPYNYVETWTFIKGGTFTYSNSNNQTPGSCNAQGTYSNDLTTIYILAVAPNACNLYGNYQSDFVINGNTMNWNGETLVKH